MIFLATFFFFFFDIRLPSCETLLPCCSRLSLRMHSTSLRIHGGKLVYLFLIFLKVPLFFFVFISSLLFTAVAMLLDCCPCESLPFPCNSIEEKVVVCLLPQYFFSSRLVFPRPHKRFPSFSADRPSSFLGFVKIHLRRPISNITR